MILECPSCHARYLVPDSALGAEGRMVRCARCKHSWFEKPATPPASGTLADLDTMLSEVKPVEARPIPRGSNLPKRREPAVPVGLKSAVIAMGVITTLLFFFWLQPGWFGFPPSNSIVLTDVNMLKQERDIGQRPVYTITGQILNRSEEARRVPILRITLVDREGNALQFWDLDSNNAMLDAKKNMPFSRELEVKFSRGERFVVELGNALELALRRKP